MSIRKYEFIPDDTIEYKGRTLTRIRRISDGLVGGFIETEENLSHEGSCFIFHKAMAYGNAKVIENAKMFNCSRAYGNVTFAGHAEMFDNSIAYGRACIYGFTRLRDNCKVHGSVSAFGYSTIREFADVRGMCSIYGYAIILHNIRGTGENYSSGVF